MNLIDGFTQDLFKHLTHSACTLKGGIIKKHSENFDSHGEISFPLDIKPWKHYIENDDNNIRSILEFAYCNSTSLSDIERCERLVNDSELWTLRIGKCQIVDKRLYIFLDRTYAVKQYLHQQPNYDEPLSFNSDKVNITQDKYNAEDLSACRLGHFVEVSKNLLHISGYSVVTHDSSDDFTLQLNFTMKAANKNSNGRLNIFSAPVLNEKSGSKELETSSTDYLSKRIMDMQLIAQHKYGLRVKNEEQWKAFLEQIGQAAVIFDLLQNKPSHPVSVSSVDSASGSSKGVAFVLYNCARLSAIIRKYNESVESGLYQQLSPVEDVDFGLINDTDEWILMFNFMMGYGSLLKKCVDLSSKDCPIAPHQLCSYLSGLAGRFSMYYRRIRILLEPRKHLVPLVEARIHFLLALQKILHHALHILNIVPVTQM